MIGLLFQACVCVSSVAGAGDSTLALARAALDAGRPWEATQVMAPVLADAKRRTPEAVLLAATAAAGWSGWEQVYQLLSSESWLDTMARGEGRRLFVRAALERRTDSLALRAALDGVRAAPEKASAELLVLLAQALERVGQRDSAVVVYQKAAGRLPVVADWLRLRAIGVSGDSVLRARLLAAIGDSVIRKRAPWSIAAARESTGDWRGAAADYAALGARVRALTLRVGAKPDSAGRAAIRRELVGLLGKDLSGSELRGAVELLDREFGPLSAAEQLAVARVTGKAIASRAVEGYRLALKAGLGTSADRFDYATALFRLGRYSDAAFQFNLVTKPHSLAGMAAYQRARALMRDGQLSEAHSALLEVARRFAADTAAASSALFLLADLATDRQEDLEARRLFRQVAVKYPSSSFGPAAHFRAAIIAFTADSFALAAAELDALVGRHPSSNEVAAAIYWSGRAFAARGDSMTARARWEAVLRRDPLSYYASLGARRLGRASWVPVEASDHFVAVPGIDSVVARAALLARLGFSTEAGVEYRRVVDWGSTTTATEPVLAAADVLRRAGRASDAISLARKALSRGAPADARLYRLLYPVIHRDALMAEATEQALDPSFVAALVRQESMFNPIATSPVGARGLTQIMPQVGAMLARTRNYPVWDPVLLYQPDVSLQLGALHVRELAEKYAAPVRILAAYNAGASRVERWSQKRGVSDPELFAERIPYVETRDYVRIIQRNQEMYRALYEWPGLVVGS